MTVVSWSMQEHCSLEVIHTSLQCDSPVAASDYCRTNFKVLRALWEGLIQNTERLTGISD